MGYKIENTPLAEQDLDGILSYIAENLGNKTAAVSFLDEVDACYINLERMPFMYEQCRDPQLRALGYRKAIIKNYVYFILILRIILPLQLLKQLNNIIAVVMRIYGHIQILIIIN